MSWLTGIPWFEVSIILIGLIFLLYLEGFTHGYRWRWLCYVFPHRWCFVGNREMETYADESQRFGLYQCKRCEHLNVGPPR